MNDKNNLIIILLIVLLVAILGFGGYAIYSLNHKIDLQNETINELKKSNSDKESNVNDNRDQTSLEETIRNLFLAKLKKRIANSSEKVLDYRIDEVHILSDSEKQDIISWDDYNSSDVYALVTYSIKVENVDTSEWAAGNGEIEGEWVINKSSCERLHDNKLGDYFATSW